jgi:hypothetical protein
VRGHTENAPRHGFQLLRDNGNDRRNADRVEIESFTARDAGNVGGEIVRRRAVIRRGVPVADQAVASKDSDVGSRIADVDCKEHGFSRMVRGCVYPTRLSG